MAVYNGQLCKKIYYEQPQPHTIFFTGVVSKHW